MTRSGGKRREWTEEEFQKRKQFVIDYLNNLSPDSTVLQDKESGEIWAHLVMSGMYRIQYEKKFQEFKDKWLEMKKLYIDMIELLFKDGDLTKGYEYEDARVRIREDCKQYNLGMTDKLEDHINRYFLTKDDREYLEQFVDYPEQTTK